MRTAIEPGVPLAILEGEAPVEVAHGGRGNGGGQGFGGEALIDETVRARTGDGHDEEGRALRGRRRVGPEAHFHILRVRIHLRHGDGPVVCDVAGGGVEDQSGRGAGDQAGGDGRQETPAIAERVLSAAPHLQVQRAQVADETVEVRRGQVGREKPHGRRRSGSVLQGQRVEVLGEMAGGSGKPVRRVGTRRHRRGGAHGVGADLRVQTLWRLSGDAAGERRLQQRQRHGRLQNRAREFRVLKRDPGLRLLPQHFKRPHGDTPVGLPVIQKHEGQRGEAVADRNVEIVPQRKGLPTLHEGVLLIGVEPGECPVVLVVNVAVGLQADQGAGAVVTGQDNFRGRGGILHGVASDHGRPVAVQEALGHIDLVLAEPPDLQQIFSGHRIHRNNGTTVGLLEAGHERIHISQRMV